MTKRFKKASMILLALFLAVACVCSIVNTNIKAYADEDQTDIEETESEVDEIVGGPGFHHTLPDFGGAAIYYEYNSTYANVTVSQYPMITVLTHGMGSDASVWSNNMSVDNFNNETVQFAYDEFSLIERLRSKSNAIGNQVVRAVISSTVSPRGTTYSSVLKKVEPIVSATGVEYSVNPDTISLTDLVPTKHLIIIYDSLCTATKSNEEDFKAFKAMLVPVINMLKSKNNNIYPKINLIGHSRGGLTNLAFAMAHPELIYSLTSIGTPYFGSNFGRIKYFTHIMKNNGIPIDETEAFESIQDEFVQTSMVEKWNNKYNSKYSNIKLKILGGYSRIIYLKEIVENGSFNTENMRAELNEFINGLKLAATLPDTVAERMTNKINEAVQLTFQEEDWAKYTITKSEMKKVLVEAMLNNEQGNSVGDHFTNVYDDMLVSLNSQLGRVYNGVSYMGFSDHTHCKYFGNIRNIQQYKYAQPTFPVVHNLETRDPFFVNEIVYGKGRPDDTSNFGTEIDEATDMGLEMGTFDKNMAQVPTDGSEIVSDAVIIRSDMGATKIQSDRYGLADCDEISINWIFAQSSMNVDFTTLPAVYNRIDIRLTFDVRKDNACNQWIGLFNTDNSVKETGELIIDQRLIYPSVQQNPFWQYSNEAEFGFLLFRYENGTTIPNFADGVIVLRYKGTGTALPIWRCRNIKITIRIYSE